jgi:threonine dehydrogenase-like Zn-dependent dehydrogenase
VPESCLVSVPEHVPDEHAVFAEPLAAALHVLDDLPADASTVVVLGDGKLAQLIARALVSRERRALVVGHHADKLELARRAGAEVILEKDVGKDLNGVPAVVEATGSRTGLELALRITRPRGTLILKTTVASSIQVDLSPVVINELRVVGSRCGDLRQAIDALSKREVDPSPLVASRYPLGRANEAFVRAAEPATLKVLLEGPGNA